MNQQSVENVRERTRAIYKRAARLPIQAWIMFGLFILGTVVLLSVHSGFATKNAALHIKLKHDFRDAKVQVWVDDELAYSGRLIGSARKKFGLIPTDSAQGSFSQIIPVRSGRHIIRLQIDGDGTAAQEDSIEGDFANHGERDLTVSARHTGINLTWQGTDNPTIGSSVASGRYSQYANSLLLTVIGSVVSALAGYAIKELPARLRSAASSSKRSLSHH